MKHYQIPCGKKSIAIQILDHVPVQWAESRKMAPVPNVIRAVEEALSRPIGTPRLRELVKPNQTVALVVTDITRQLHEEIILPLLLRELEAGGIKKADITAVVATGTHRPNTPEELKKIIPEYDAIIVRSEAKLKRDIIEAATRLKVIGRAGIGLDNVDLPAATKKGIVVMNTPQENAIAAAEHTIAMMLSISRKIPQATSSMRGGKWEKKKFMGVELYNKTLGLVGIGVIGTVVADRARGLKMKVIGYDPYLSKETAEKKGVDPVSFDELLSRSDFISVHTPLTDETRNLIDKNAFSKMKNGVILVNCARGGIINEKDLHDAIRGGKVAGAALDVFEKEPAIGNPLLELEEVIGTPHLGASTGEAQENVATAISQQVMDYLLSGEARNAVNMPAVSPDILPYLITAESTLKFYQRVQVGHDGRPCDGFGSGTLFEKQYKNFRLQKRCENEKKR
jgi:D-3-phosphoglycerate dehydrogenase